MSFSALALIFLLCSVLYLDSKIDTDNAQDAAPACSQDPAEQQPHARCSSAPSTEMRDGENRASTPFLHFLVSAGRRTKLDVHARLLIVKSGLAIRPTRPRETRSSLGDRGRVDRYSTFQGGLDRFRAESSTSTQTKSISPKHIKHRNKKIK